MRRFFNASLIIFFFKYLGDISDIRYLKKKTTGIVSPPGSCTSERSAPSYVAASAYTCGGAGQKRISDLEFLPGLPACTSIPQSPKCAISGPVCCSASRRET